MKGKYHENHLSFLRPLTRYDFPLCLFLDELELNLENKAENLWNRIIKSFPVTLAYVNKVWEVLEKVIFYLRGNITNWLESSWYPLVSQQSLLKRKTWIYLKEHRPCTPPSPPPQTTCWEPELYRTYGGKLSAWIITEMVAKLVNFEKYQTDV